MDRIIILLLSLVGVGCGQGSYSPSQYDSSVSNQASEMTPNQSHSDSRIIRGEIQTSKPAVTNSSKPTQHESYSCWQTNEKHPGLRNEFSLDKNQDSDHWTLNYRSMTQKQTQMSQVSNKLKCKFFGGNDSKSAYCFEESAQKSPKTYVSAIKKSEQIEVRIQSPEFKAPEVLTFSLNSKTADCNALF